MKSIALIADLQGWAFDIQAKLIQSSLKNNFKIDIYYSKQEPYNEDIVNIIEAVKDYDIIHFFWRKTLLQICTKENQKKLMEKGINIEELKNKLSTGIYDHLFIGEDEYNELLSNICKKYVTSSKKLYDIYSKNIKIKAPFAILGDTFDEKKFYPMNLERFKEQPLVLGWVGNSSWNNKLKDEKGDSIDFKGFHTVLMPVVKELQNEGYNIELYCADKNTNFIPNDEMCNYYSKIHVYICVSISEGTPRPLLEAMGCGVPIITTNVGVAEEYLGINQKKFIIKERKIGTSDKKIREELKERIVYLYNNREMLEELSKENFNMSEKINNKIYSEKYKKYFQDF